MTIDRLQRLLIWLLIIAAVIYLLDRALMVFAILASPLLLFALAWLCVLALKPLVDGLTRVELLVPTVRTNTKTRRMQVAGVSLHMPRSAAVLLIYLGLLALLIGIAVLLVPVIVPQLAGLQESLPLAAQQTQVFLNQIQQYINRMGLRANLSAVLQPETLAAQFGALGGEAVKQSLTIAGSIATLLFNTVFVLIISFYMMTDGERLIDRGLALLPLEWRDETRTFLSIVDRTFGGFLRAQLLQSLLYGIGTAVVMFALGLPDIALASLIAGLCVLIPIVGGPLAMIPPVLIAIIGAPNQLLWLIIGLLVLQQIVFNVIMPRLLGQIVGLPPLLVFAALLLGSTLAGGWGILFGIPIAGVLASVVQFMYDRSNAERSAHSARVATPTNEPSPAHSVNEVPKNV